MLLTSNVIRMTIYHFEFAYNNSYNSSIVMALFEALYRRRFTSPIWWIKVGEFSFISPETVYEDVEKIWFIKNKLKTPQNRKKSDANNRKRDLEFEVGYVVCLKISPMKG